MALPKYPIMSVEDYLILDRGSKEMRYEYLEGMKLTAIRKNEKRRKNTL